jgi:hypothetical protein
MNFKVLENVTPCGFVYMYRRVGEDCCHDLQVAMETALEHSKH